MANDSIGLAAFPSLGSAYTIGRNVVLDEPVATMPFIKALSKKYRFDITDEWISFIGQNPRIRKHSARDKFDSYISEIQLILGIHRTTLLSKTRDRNIVQARQMLAFICHCNKIGTKKEIGELIGMDRSTVIHSLKVVDELVQTNDKLFIPTYNALSHLIVKFGNETENM